MEAEAEPDLLTRAEEAARAVLANPEDGLRRSQQVVEAARVAPHPEALTVALRAAGFAARELYRHAEAERLLDEAVEVAREAGLPGRLSEALVTRAALHLEEGHPGRARRDLTAAEKCAPPEAAAEVAFSRGVAEEKAGNFEAAAVAYERAIAAAPEHRVDVLTKAHINRGLAAMHLGDHPGAERHLTEAIELAETFSPAYAAIAVHNRAWAALEAGRPVEALRLYDEAEARLRAAGLPLVEHYLDKAHAFLALRLLDEAAAASRQAVRELDVPGGRLLLGEALLLEARTALLQARAEDSQAGARQAADLFGAQRRWGYRAEAALLVERGRYDSGQTDAAMLPRLRRIQEALTRVGHVSALVEAALLEGRVARNLGRTRRSAAAWRRAADLAAGGPTLMRVQGRIAQALHAEMMGDRAAVSRWCRRGLDELDGARLGFASAELRARAAGHGRELAEIGLRSALSSGDPYRVWGWMERTRAVVLTGTAPPDPDDELRPMLAELRTLTRQLEAGEGAVEEDQARLLREVARAEHRIRLAAWRRQPPDDAASLGAATRRRLESLRAQLGARALLEYGVVDGRLVAVAATPRQARLVELGAVEEVSDTGRSLAFCLRRITRPISAGSSAAALTAAREDLQALVDALVAPLRTEVEEAAEVIIVPPGDLVGFPWQALLGSRPVRVAPSAMLWSAAAARLAPSDRVVMVAGPGLDHAPAEVDHLRRVYPDATRLGPDEATCEVVRRQASGARMVHLACHGHLRVDSPTFSSFALADGPMTVHDLERLEEPAHCWVLAACDLGNPGVLAGPDLEGVLAALLASGAAGVVAATTAVPDLATSRLMIELHTGLSRGLPLAEALWTAKGALEGDDPEAFVTTVAFTCFGGG